MNPGIANEFSTAGFRVGHSMLGDDVEFVGDDGLEVTEGVPLSGAFFNPALLADFGIDPVLKYLASDPSSEIDSTIVNSVLFPTFAKIQTDRKFGNTQRRD